MNVDRIRKNFPVCNKWNYLNTAAVGPSPNQVIEAENKFHQEQIMGNLYYDKWENVAIKTKKLIGDLIHASSNEIALVSNTGEGINIILNGIMWSSRDNVVTNDLEFMSNLFPWQWLSQRKRVELRIVKNKNNSLALSEYEKLIDDKTKIVTISHVEFSNGFRHELKSIADIAHRHGAYLLVDGIQSAGAINVDVVKNNVDFFVCGGSKWLLSPPGTGFLYLRKRVMKEIIPTYIGWRNDRSWNDYRYRKLKLRNDPIKYEYGTPNFAGIYGLRAALQLILDIGMEQIERHNILLSERLLTGLSSLDLKILSSNDRKERGPIVTYKPAKPVATFEKIRKKCINASIRNNHIRFSPDFFNTKEEIDTVIETISTIEKK